MSIASKFANILEMSSFNASAIENSRENLGSSCGSSSLGISNIGAEDALNSSIFSWLLKLLGLTFTLFRFSSKLGETMLVNLFSF